MYRFLIPLAVFASTPQPTRWDSFMWDEGGVKLLKFIGDETEVVIPYVELDAEGHIVAYNTFLDDVSIRQKAYEEWHDGKELPFRMQGNKIELSLGKSGTLEFQFR